MALTLVVTVSPGLLATEERPAEKVEVGPSASPKVSVPLGSLPTALQPNPYIDKAEDRVNPLAFEPDQGRRGTWGRSSVPDDPLAAAGYNPGHRTPTPLLTFAGTGNPTGCNGCSPPDTVGDVGPKHYVQMVNATKVAVYDKGGALLFGPTDLSNFWSSGACTADLGDPVVVYDPLADRWVLAQFNGAATLCFAVSQTADPLGSYFIYAFTTTDFPDYFKVAVWPDGYYVSTNESNYNAWAFDRVKMLQGLAATSQKASGFADNLLMPADVDGLVAPPPGAPAIYYTFLDNSFHGGTDRLELRAFHVDWVTPANSTFTVVGSPAVTAFTYTVCGFFNLSCATQPGTTQKVDVVSEVTASPIGDSVTTRVWSGPSPCLPAVAPHRGGSSSAAASRRGRSTRRALTTRTRRPTASWVRSRKTARARSRSATRRCREPSRRRSASPPAWRWTSSGRSARSRR
jgi:hypothetical protein